MMMTMMTNQTAEEEDTVTLKPPLTREITELLSFEKAGAFSRSSGVTIRPVFSFFSASNISSFSISEFDRT